jgi:hypothetical protein
MPIQSALIHAIDIAAATGCNWLAYPGSISGFPEMLRCT